MSKKGDTERKDESDIKAFLGWFENARFLIEMGKFEQASGIMAQLENFSWVKPKLVNIARDVINGLLLTCRGDLNHGLELLEDVLQRCDEIKDHGKFRIFTDTLNVDQRYLMATLFFEALLARIEVLIQLARYTDARDAIESAEQVLNQFSLGKNGNVYALRVRYYRAMLAWRLGELIEARDLVEEGLSLLTNKNSPLSLRALYLNLRGSISRSLGDFDQALAYYRQSLELERQLGNKYNLAITLNNLGMTHHVKGEFDVALACLEESLKLKEEIGNKPQIAATFNNIGLVYSDKNELDRALSYFRRSLVLKKEIGNFSQVASTLNNIALIHYKKGELDEALKYLQQCLELDKKIGNKQDIATSLNNIGLIYQTKGELDKAISFLEQSLHLKEEIGNEREIAETMFCIGTVNRARGKLEEALKCFKRSLALRQKIGNRVDIAEVLFSLILVLLELPEESHSEQAREYLKMLADCNEKEHDALISQRYRVCQALFLLKGFKERVARRDRWKAEILLDEVISEAILHQDVTKTALLILCRHLIQELRFSSDPDLLRRAQEVSRQLLEVGKLQKSQLIAAESLWLQAKLALVEGRITEARRLLVQAQITAEECGLERMAELISKEHDHLLDQINQWKELTQSKANLSQRVEMARVEEGLQNIMRGQQLGMEVEDFEDHVPVYLFIISESGILIASREFSEGLKGDPHLISNLLVAVTNFSQEIIGQGLDRMRIGNYTILMLPDPPLLLAYVFEGSSMSASRVLRSFKKYLSENVEFRRCLLEGIPSGEKLASSVQEELDKLITRIFVLR